MNNLNEIMQKNNPANIKREVNKSEYIKLIDRNTELVDEINCLKIDNERLNKIIYEYEKWLIERVSDGSNMEENHIYVILLKKIQELKNGDKEWEKE